MTQPTSADTAAAIAVAVRGRTRSAIDVVSEHLDRIARLEPAVHAWQALDPALPLARAAEVDDAVASGHAGAPLTGVPVGVKDLIDSVDWPTAYGSPLYAGHRPTRDATVLSRLKEAGAVPMGKTVTTEFGYFQPGPTANPRRTTHTPGGSSSGSAAAVAAGMVPLAFGTQTAGSLIRPASYCGVWALKPTHGVFSLDGVKGMSPSLDTLGWLANNADDLELMRCALAGETPLALDTVASPRLAAWLTHEAALLDDSGRHAWNQAQRLLAQAGLAPHPVAMPADLARLFDAQKIVMAYEAARTLAPEAAQHRDRLGTALLQLLDGGIGIADADYRAALALADAGRRWFAAALAGVDALVVPAAPGEAPVGLAATGDPAFSRVWTLLGLPCVAVPGLVGPGGLPVGLQLVGHAGRERALLSVARRLGPVLAGGGQAGA